MANCVLSRLPEKLQTYPVARKAWEKESVFVQVLKNDTYSIPITDPADPLSEILIDLPKDSIHLLPFVSIVDQLEDGRVMLL